VNELLKKYSEQIHSILAKYPPEHKRSAVMPLLFLAQRESGAVSRQAMSDIAEVLEISETEVASIVGFYTLFHEEDRQPPEGGGIRYRIQICTDLPCALRGSEEFADKLCERLGVKIGEPTADGMFVVEKVMCLAACHRAPVIQLQGNGRIDYYEEQTVEKVMELIASLRRSAAEVQR